MFSKFKQFIGYSDDEFYDEEYLDEGTSAMKPELEKEISDIQQEKIETIPSHPANPYNAPVPSSIPAGKEGTSKIVQIHAGAQNQVVLVKPERFEDASGIADHLNQKRTIVLNLESANKDVTRRLIDFLSGVAYANNGQIRRVANSTYIITPYNVDIVGDIIDELENSGVFF